MIGIEKFIDEIRAAVAQLNTGLYALGARDGAIITAVVLIITYLIVRRQGD